MSSAMLLHTRQMAVSNYVHVVYIGCHHWHAIQEKQVLVFFRYLPPLTLFQFLLHLWPCASLIKRSQSTWLKVTKHLRRVSSACTGVDESVLECVKCKSLRLLMLDWWNGRGDASCLFVLAIFIISHLIVGRTVSWLQHSQSSYHLRSFKYN